TAEKLSELLLFFGVGGLAGALVDRERALRWREQGQRLAQLEAEARAERLAGLVHLARGLAHELRNPLGGLQGAVEIAAEAVPPGDPRRGMARLALAETARLNRVLEEFQDFARPRAPDPRPFEPGDVLRHTAEVLAPEARERGLALRVRPGQAPRVLADPEQVTQVLVNLVKNALQATPHGGWVELEASPAGESVRLRVSDTGPGVPAALGDSIYDPYVTGREGGSGLGLAISAMLVRQNHGRLGHAARPGGGAVFSIELPCATGGPA
ncbi:MAG TPA: ATP-binding protein, partial [Myxococcota bacterium]|nr:ATP-binding protein [Myxococcota bacterium]